MNIKKINYIFLMIWLLVFLKFEGGIVRIILELLEIRAVFLGLYIRIYVSIICEYKLFRVLFGDKENFLVLYFVLFFLFLVICRVLLI